MAIAAALVLLFGAWFGLRAWLIAYLHGPDFHRFINARLGETLGAEVQCAPLRFEGLDFFCESIQAHGYEDSPFSKARLEQVRARISLRKIFQRVWEIERIGSERLTLEFDGTRVAAPPARASLSDRPAQNGWLPNRLEVSVASIDEVNITWEPTESTAGALRGVSVEVRPAGTGWNIDGEGGALLAAGMPPLDVVSIRVRQRGSVMFVNDAKFHGRTGGNVAATGEVDFGKGLDLQARIEGVDMEPFLAEDWRARLHGRMSGDIRVQGVFPSAGTAPEVSGVIRIDGGRIEALPVLDQIALFTRTREFRQLSVTSASGEFRRDASGLHVTKMTAESEGRLRIEGGFVAARGEIDGSFQIGVPPGLLAWLPGSQEKVFTVARDGYLWAPMRLTGPLNAPREDLSNRLVVAAGETVLEKADSITRDAIQTGKDAAKSALDLLLPLFK